MIRNRPKGIDPKKVLSYDLITGKILKELPENGIIFLIQIYNAILRINFIPPQWKVAEIIDSQTRQLPEEAKSCRLISLLPILFKIFEKLVLARLMPIIKERNLISIVNYIISDLEKNTRHLSKYTDYVR